MDLHIVEITIFCYMTPDKRFYNQAGPEKEQPCGKDSKQV